MYRAARAKQAISSRCAPSCSGSSESSQLSASISPSTSEAARQSPASFVAAPASSRRRTLRSVATHASNAPERASKPSRSDSAAIARAAFSEAADDSASRARRLNTSTSTCPGLSATSFASVSSTPCCFAGSARRSALSAWRRLERASSASASSQSSAARRSRLCRVPFWSARNAEQSPGLARRDLENPVAGAPEFEVSEQPEAQHRRADYRNPALMGKRETINTL